MSDAESVGELVVVTIAVSISTKRFLTYFEEEWDQGMEESKHFKC